MVDNNFLQVNFYHELRLDLWSDLLTARTGGRYEIFNLASLRLSGKTKTASHKNLRFDIITKMIFSLLYHLLNF